MKDSAMEKSSILKVPVQGGWLSVERNSDTPSLVFIHGMASTLSSWDELLAQLDNRYAYARYDLRGFGNSSKLTIPYSHFDDLAALLDNLKIQKAVLVGVSLGGAIATHFALEQPEAVERLILISPALYGWRWSEEWKAQWRLSSQAARVGNIDQARALWLKHPMFQPLLGSPLGEKFATSLNTYDGQHWLDDPHVPTDDDRPKLSQLQMPVLLMNGGKDIEDFQGISRLMKDNINNIASVTYPDAGHMVHIEKSAEVAVALTQFLKDNN